jgi:hypothetical protein
MGWTRSYGGGAAPEIGQEVTFAAEGEMTQLPINA